MTQAQFLADWIQDVVLIGFVAAVLFPVAAAFILPWWRHAFGLNMIALDLALGIALFPAVLHRVFGVSLTSIAYTYVIAISLTIVPIVIVWRFWVIYKTQRAGARLRRMQQLHQEDKSDDSQRETQ